MTPLDALQAALAAEHAAVYLTGVLGAQTSKAEQPVLYGSLLRAYRAHRRRRDQLTVLIAGRGGVPVSAAVAYELPAALDTVSDVNDAALQLERRIATTYGQLIENTTGAERRWALVALENSAVVQLEFRGTPEMFPGSSN
ncbi:MAG: DUF4439 domain-containing protein [Propionibacteriales bacterium]|nr:DUF4439 domain-containing protein [Propionibacteriales bacterium]